MIKFKASFVNNFDKDVPLPLPHSGRKEEEDEEEEEEQEGGKSRKTRGIFPSRYKLKK